MTDNRIRRPRISVRPSRTSCCKDGTPVYDRAGTYVGTVEHVLADEPEDVFHGLIIKTDDGHRFAGGSQVDGIYERGVIVAVPADQLPEPSADAAARVADDDGLGERPEAGLGVADPAPIGRQARQRRTGGADRHAAAEAGQQHQVAVEHRARAGRRVQRDRHRGAADVAVAVQRQVRGRAVQLRQVDEFLRASRRWPGAARSGRRPWRAARPARASRPAPAARGRRRSRVRPRPSIRK